MELPAIDGHDETACYESLVNLLHPQGLECPKCKSREGWHIHRRHRAPVLDYRCTRCQRVFNAWTGTVLCNTHLPPHVLWLLMESIVHQQSLTGVARATNRARSSLVVWHLRLRRFLRDSLLHREARHGA
jgi:transposase-like protein